MAQQQTDGERRAARWRELRETLHALRRIVLLFAIVLLSPLAALAYSLSRGEHPLALATAFRNALLLVPVAFGLIWLGLGVGEWLMERRGRDE